MHIPKHIFAAGLTLAVTATANGQYPQRTAPEPADSPAIRSQERVPPSQQVDPIQSGTPGANGANPGWMNQGGTYSGGASPGGAAAPGGYISPGQPPLPPGPLRRRDVSWIYMERPRPRKVGVHDIITVIVDEKSEVTQNSRFNRTRNAVYTAQLKEWLRINSTGDLDVAAGNSPGINGQLRSQLQSMGQGLSTEGMKYRIAATVVDILPNGTLILEAHKSIRTNTEVWDYSLTGRIRSQDVSGANEVRSENIADLMIAKREQGKIYDSTKRGWLQRFYDFLLPF